MNTRKRPLTVSIISWVLIVTAAVSFLFLPISFNSPTTREAMKSSGATPIEVLITSLLGGIASIVAGVLMLRGARVGRQLFFVATPVAILAVMYIYSFAFLPLYFLGFMIYLLILFLLTRPGPSRYFSRLPEANPGQGDASQV